MNKLFKKVYDEKMLDGSIEEIISNKLDEIVKSTFSDLFGYRGEFRNQLESKLKEVSSDLIENTDFSSYVEKIKFLINENTKNSSLEEFSKITNTMQDLISTPKYEHRLNISLSEIFAKYKELTYKYLECSDYEDLEIEDSDDGQMYGNFTFEFEVQDIGYSSSRKVVTFKTTNEQTNEEIEDLKASMYLYISDTKTYITDIPHEKNLLNLNNFEMELVSLKNVWANIKLDEYSNSSEETIYWDIEY